MSSPSLKTYVINIIGGPGVGKSTLSALIYAQLKLNKYVTEYVQEYAKQLVWTKDFSKLNNQYYVTDHQYSLFKRMEGLVDFIVTDGPLCHGLYYNIYNPDNTSNVEKTEEKILECHREFRNINIVLKRGRFEYETQGRLQDKNEAIDIDGLIKEQLVEHEIPFKEFVASPDRKTIEAIIQYIETNINLL
ncbi:MAG: AAA family ATPase [Candidatus Colwellbacteria bacterium]|nr:AAA family ATPase [Candidatus Colwellbacteria bacterium]